MCLAYQQASRARVLHNHKQDARVFEILEEQHNVITGIKTHPGFLRGLKKKTREKNQHKGKELQTVVFLWAEF